MSAVQAMPSVPTDVSTCSAPSAVCVTQALNLVPMANSATVRKDCKKFKSDFYKFQLLLKRFLCANEKNI